jgi:hypothetical protein
VHGTSGQDFIFVVIGNGDEKLCMAVIHCRTQIIAILEGKVIGITGCSRI